MAGPYTRRAAGEEMDLAPLPEQGDIPGIDPGTGGGMSPTDAAIASQDQVQGEAVQRGRTAPGIRVADSSYGPTTDEIFTNRGRSILEGHSTGVGKYQGAPLFVGDGGLLPLGIAGGKIRSIKAEQAALAKQAKDLDLYGGFDKVDRAEYEPALHGIANATVEGWHQAAINAYGGDKIAAAAAFNDKNSKWHQGLYKDVENINTVTRLVNQNIGDAQDIIKGMDEGTLEMDEGTYKDAEEVLTKTGEWGEKDWEHLAELNKRFSRRMNLMLRLKNDGVAALLKSAQQRDEQQQAPKKDKFGRVIDVKNSTENADAAVEQLTPRYAKLSGLPEDQVRNMLSSMAPRKIEVDLKGTWPPSDGGSDSGTKPGTIVMGLENRTVTTYDEAAGKIHRVNTGGEPWLRVGETVAGRTMAMAPRPLSTINKDGGVTQEWIIVDHNSRDPKAPGGYTIHGKVTKQPGTNYVKDPTSGEFVLQTDAPMDPNSQQFKALPDIEVAYEGNEAAIDGMLKGSDWKKQFGQVASAPETKPKASTAKPKNGETRQDGARWSDKYQAWLKPGKTKGTWEKVQ